MKIFFYLFIFIMLVGCTKETAEEEEPQRDDEMYGVIEEKWEVTPTFITEGKVFMGSEGKVGFLQMDFVAREFQDVFWHFWGEPEEIDGVVRVEGTHLSTNQKSPILVKNPNSRSFIWEIRNGFTQSVNGATKTMPSYVEFEQKGFWKINVFVDTNHFGEFIIEVK